MLLTYTQLTQHTCVNRPRYSIRTEPAEDPAEAERHRAQGPHRRTGGSQRHERLLQAAQRRQQKNSVLTSTYHHHHQPNQSPSEIRTQVRWQYRLDKGINRFEKFTCE